MKNFIKLFIFSSLFLVILTILSEVFRPSWNTDTALAQLKDHTNEYDVLFIGDSDIFADISPMEIYKQTGIKSFDYASGNASNLLIYYMVKEATMNQKPKLVVIDDASIFNKIESEESTHWVTDSFGNDKIKWELVNDPNYNFEAKDKLKFLFPVFRFHNRWNSITTKDFLKIKNTITEENYYLKGFSISFTKKSASNGTSYMQDKDDKVDFSDSSLPEAILKTKKYCEENDIKFLLLTLPDTAAWNDAKAEKMEQFSKENNIEYLDTNTILNEIGINYETDTRDGGTHLNTYGAIKLSQYLANYIQDTYKIPKHYQDNWDEDLIKYQNYLDSQK